MAAEASKVPACAEDLRFEKCLGRGFFGEVWRARGRSTSGGDEVWRARGRSTSGGDEAAEVYAIKKVRLALILENHLSDQLQREIQILYSLQHCRIIRLHFNFSDAKAMYLGMEFASGGSLFDKLSKVGKFAPEAACGYFLETCEALDYLHHLPEKVIHRDIKPENILLDGEDHVKLADFGWANLIQADKRDTFCGTLDYLPPEMIMGTGHDESVDMWNMGVLLYELTTGSSPFASSSKETTCRMILGVDLKYPAEMDADAKDLVASLCRKKPKERLKVRDAMAHRFVRKFASGQEDEGGEDAAAQGGAPVLRCSAEEMQQLLRAQKGTEDALACAEEDLRRGERALQEERQARAELEAACEQLERRGCDRELELEELRRKTEAAQAEVAKLGRGGSTWWPIRRSTRGA